MFVGVERLLVDLPVNCSAHELQTSVVAERAPFCVDNHLQHVIHARTGS